MLVWGWVELAELQGQLQEGNLPTTLKERPPGSKGGSLHSRCLWNLMAHFRIVFIQVYWPSFQLHELLVGTLMYVLAQCSLSLSDGRPPRGLFGFRFLPIERKFFSMPPSPIAIKIMLGLRKQYATGTCFTSKVPWDHSCHDLGLYRLI